MDKPIIVMDKSAKDVGVPVKSERFRTPLSIEREIGLWVDRIGSGTGFYMREKKEYRLLGLYAAVAVEPGNGVFYSEKTGEIPVRSGDTMILFPNVPSMYGPREKWHSKWIVWGGPEAEKLERVGFLNPNQPIRRQFFYSVSNAHNILTDIIDSEDLAAILERKKIILDLIINIYKSGDAEKRNTNTASLIVSAVRQMHSLYPHEIPIPDLAKKYSLSETHFRRLFKVYTGRSPKEFMISLKISKAKEFLTQGKSIKETASLLGYRDELYFMRTFKKVTGITAGKFFRNL